jgi:MFS family permease
MPRLLADITPLRKSPPFRRLWVGTTLSALGGGLTRYAVALQVFQLTHSSFAVGLIGLFSMVPTLAVGLLGGPLTDSLDRRRLVLVTSSGLALVSVAMALLAFGGLRTAWPLYLLIAIQAGLQSVDYPARSTFISALLPPAQLPAGVNLNRTSFLIAMTFSPAAAGLITAAPSLGLPWCYGIDACSFCLALYGIARLPPLPPREKSARNLRAVREGLAFVRRSQPLAGAFLADLAFTVLGLPIALFPAINTERFGPDPRTLGLMATAVGVGGLTGAVMSGPLRHVRRQGLAMLVCVGISGAAFAGFALAPGLGLTLLCLGCVGAADGFTVVFRGTIAQTVTPDELRGRVLAADFVVAAGGSQLGSLESGALATLTTPVTSAFAGGVACAVAAVAIGVALPGLVTYRQPQE